jgi:hypothetical protein
VVGTEGDRSVMGIFKDIKNTVNSANTLAQQAGAMQAQQMQMANAAAAPTDFNDPVWSPIEGITIDRYAQLSAGLAKRGLGIADAKQYVEGEGVVPGTWEAVVNGWNARMGSTPAVMQRYGQLYSSASA